MSTILSSAMIQSAQASVDSYISQVQALNSELEGVINGLIPSGFEGDAAEGYKSFYTTKIVPAIDDNLIASGNSLTASIKQMLEDIQMQLLNTVDPQMGENNMNAGGAAN